MRSDARRHFLIRTVLQVFHVVSGDTVVWIGLQEPIELLKGQCWRGH